MNEPYPSNEQIQTAMCSLTLLNAIRKGDENERKRVRNIVVEQYNDETIGASILLLLGVH